MSRLSSICRTCSVCVLVILLVCMWPVRALADDFIVLPDWFPDYAKSVEILPEIPDEYELVLNREYVQKATKNENPAPKGTTFDNAVKNGYTTYYDGASELKISDAQKTLGEGYTAYTKDMQKAYPNSENLALDVHNRKMRLTSTSSGLQSALKTAGSENASTILASSTWGDTDLYKATIKAGGEKNTDFVKKLLSKVKVGGAVRFLNTVGAAVGGYTVGLDIGNGVVDMLKIDRTAECSTITSGFARLLLGVSSICSQFDATSYELPSYSYDLDGLCVSGAPYESWCVSGSLSAGWSESLKKPYTKFDGKTYYVKSGCTRSDCTAWASFITNNGSYPAFLFYDTSVQCGSSATSFFHCPISTVVDLIGKVDHAYSGSGDSSLLSPGTLTKVFDDNASGTITHTVKGDDGKTYTATQSYTGDPATVPYPPVSLPAGVLPAITELTWAGSDGSPKVLQPETQISYNEPVNGNSGTLDLYDVATGKSCYAEGTGCADWAKEQEERTKTAVKVDTLGKTTTDPDQKVKCVWAGSDGTLTELEIGQCAALKDSFKAGNDSVTDPATDTKVQVSPKYDESPDFAQCVKEDVSWNPVSWVFVPVKCALNWAFKPSESTLRTVNTKMRQQADTTFVDSLISAFKAQFTGKTNDSSCQGPEFHLEYNGWTIIPSSHPASVCEGSGLEFLPTFSKAVCIVLATAVSFLTIRKWAGAAVRFVDDARTDLDAK